uniref:F-box domain-containing protein n=1 Tax=Amphimedon queenslandica TaxID=400682 RepID=A0A1X7T4B9_AMPQE
MICPTLPTVFVDGNATNCSELEKCIAINKKLQKVKIIYEGLPSTIISSVIRGVTKNKTITSLTLGVEHSPPFLLLDGVIEQLLKDNNTLQALSLNIPDPSSLNIVEVKTPLTALDIRSSKLITSVLPHTKELHCLILHYEPYPPNLLFLSHPSLHTLTLPLDTAESAIELFTILQTNTTLKALSVAIYQKVFTSSMGTSLQHMLIQNQSLKYLTISMCRKTVFSPFLSFLTTGLESNTSLQHLSVPLSLNQDVKSFINCISQKNNLTEIEMYFILYRSNSNSKEKRQELAPLFYEQVLPAVTNMLQSHTTIRLLRIDCEEIFEEFEPNDYWIELIQHLYETIFIHPSLEYVEFQHNFLMRDVLYSQKMTLIDRHTEAQPHKPLPIVHIPDTSISYDDEDSSNEELDYNSPS